MRDKVLFGSLLVGFSVILYALVAWLETHASTTYNPTLFEFLVPAVAAMAAAIGVRWQRKAVFIVVTIVGFLALDALAAVVGIKDLAGQPMNLGVHPLETTLALLYSGLVVIYPLAALVLFVGRQPSCLWASE